MNLSNLVGNFLVELGIEYPVGASKYNNLMVINPVTGFYSSNDSSKYVRTDRISSYISTLYRNWLLGV